MRWRVAVAVLLVSTAGCASISDLADGGDARGTVTPVSVPEVTATATATGTATPLPPGLSRDGIDDLDALVVAHQQAVVARTYLWRAQFERVTRTGDRTERTAWTQTIWHGRGLAYRNDYNWTWSLNGTRFSYRNTSTYGTESFALRRVDSDVPNSTYYRSESSQFAGDGRPGANVTYQRIPVSDKSRMFAQQPGFAIRQYLSVSTMTVAAVERNGTRYYRVASNDTSVEWMGQFSEYSVRALVAPSGLVREVTVRYETRSDGGSRTVSYHYVYERVGGVSVPEPRWVERGRRALSNGTA